MKILYAHLLILLSLLSCSQSEKKKIIQEEPKIIEWEVDSSSIQQFTVEKNEKSNIAKSNFKNDSLRNPYHKAYLTDLSYKEIGHLILKNEVQPMDNHVTFALMDTISNCDTEFLEFYLRVFENIMKKSDGALGEAVGSFAWQFIKKRPNLFINHIDTTNSENVINWANNTVYEMYFSYPDDSLVFYCKELMKELKKIKRNDGLTLFEETMISSTESIIK